MRQADELSMTVAPRLAASGASARDTSAPAEKSAISTPSNASGVASAISMVRSPTLTLRPTERPDASRRSSPIGKARSWRTLIIVRPTTPVAPTTATVKGSRFIGGMAPQGRCSGQGTGGV